MHCLQAGLGLNVMSGDQFADEQKMGGAEEAAAASAPQQREKPSAPEPPPAPEPEPALSEEEEVCEHVRLEKESRSKISLKTLGRHL